MRDAPRYDSNTPFSFLALADPRKRRDRAAPHQKSRYYDQRITLYAPKETIREILLKDYQSRLEHPNASKEKIRRMTVPGETLEHGEAPETKSSRQSKSKTAAGKKTKSAAMK